MTLRGRAVGGNRTPLSSGQANFSAQGWTNCRARVTPGINLERICSRRVEITEDYAGKSGAEQGSAVSFL